MIDVDKIRFGRALGALAEVYGATVSPGLASAYFHSLSRFDIVDLEAAMHALLAEPGRAFMPKPGEIVAKIEGLPDERALRAWVRIETAAREVGAYASVDFQDPVLHAVIVQYGGWQEVCNWARLPGDAYGYKRHEFLQAFKLAEKLAPSMSEPIPHLPGIFEIQNQANRGAWVRGALDYQDVVQVIGPHGYAVTQRALPASRPVGALGPGPELPNEPVDVKALVEQVKRKALIPTVGARLVRDPDIPREGK